MVHNPEKITELLNRRVQASGSLEALKILLSSRNCWTNGEPEIAEEISAQFDINLDDARKICDLLKDAAPPTREVISADTERLDWLEQAGSLPKMITAMEQITASRKGRGPSCFWREAIDVARGLSPDVAASVGSGENQESVAGQASTDWEEKDDHKHVFDSDGGECRICHRTVAQMLVVETPMPMGVASEETGDLERLIEIWITEALDEISDHALAVDGKRVLFGKVTASHYIKTRLVEPLIATLTTQPQATQEERK